ncbi:MAG: M20/M25/M40 family metallo-hydrolase [Campylobacterales bacterium]|nr:M20/M25/M40 family metallo-hydrolase [Campylobacterales bacterium]
MTPIEIFEKIAKDIPRCSKNADKMVEFIKNYAENLGFEVQIDSFKNILCRKKLANICLQSHYDMVCVGDTQNIVPIIENGWMRAANSTLGADNGIGVAMMLSLMEYFDEAEYLFTSDEEIGLIGAKNIGLKISSNKVLNLDSEEEGAIYVACAGGVDISGTREYKTMDTEGEFYEVSLADLPGGHSGVDIDKNIPNAILELAKALKSKNALIASFVGGEKRNSIPANAKAVVCVQNTQGLEAFNPTPCVKSKVIKDSSEFLDMLCAAPNGVFEMDFELGIPESSANLGLISLADGKCALTYSLRSMKLGMMNSYEKELVAYLQYFDFETNKNDFYEPWEWSADEFCIFVKSVYKKHFINASFKAIHAGLECAALKKHFPTASFASVGPNIEYPHSTKERVEIDSVNKTYNAVFDLVKKVVSCD